MARNKRGEDSDGNVIDTGVGESVEETNVESTPKAKRQWSEEQKAKLSGLWTAERRAAFAEQMKEKYSSGTLKGRPWTQEQKDAHRELMKVKAAAKKAASTPATE